MSGEYDWRAPHEDDWREEYDRWLDEQEQDDDE